VNEKALRTALLGQPVPDEHIAEERTWETVRAAYLAREPLPRRRRAPKRLLLVLALAAAGAAIALSPAGPAIGGWIRDTVGRDTVVGVAPARPVLAALPAPGQVLVTSKRGVWIVSEDGSRRHLGKYGGATWSPHGLFVAAWRGRQLVALDPAKTDFVHWTLSRGRIADARWSSSGFRVAYRSDASLRVVVGNGTGDRELAREVARVAPAWRPGREEVLAYAARDGRVSVVDADTGAAVWRTARLPRILALAWTDDAARLAVLSERQLRVFEAPKRLLDLIRLPAGIAGTAVAARPASHDVAYSVFAAATGEGQVFLYDGKASRLLFAGAGRFDGLAWSPDGRLLLIGWDAADQWLYVPADGRGEVSATANVARQFDPGGTGPAPFPRIEGWCCAEGPG
jgi:hypothetical protein